MTFEPSPAGRKKAHGHYIIYLVVAFLGVMITWASFAELSSVVRGSGRVVPRVQTQLVQNLEGGIVQEISVAVGDRVEAGDVIVQMNDAEYRSAYQELLEQSLSLQIRLARLEAEGRGDAVLQLPADLQAQAELTAQSEIALHAARMAERETTLIGMEQVRELRAEEVALLEPMIERNAYPKVNFLQSQLALATAAQELDVYLDQTEAERSSTYAETALRLQQIEQQLKIRKDQLDRTLVRSPVTGTVNKIYLNTIGGVVSPGEPILEILPHDDQLRIEGRIDPKDIGFVYVGMPATIKFSAFDFAVYGTVSGEVQHVSIDTVTDETDRTATPYYEVMITLATQSLTGGREVVDIRPGLQADIELESGSRTVLAYLLKPLFRATTAFSEP